jgi:hypothetical protein
VRGVDGGTFGDYPGFLMKVYKRNQVEEAILRTLGARDERVKEVRFRLKRLLAADRRMGTDPSSGEAEASYAFFDQKPPGSGNEVMFSGYDAFALLAAIILLEHGLPQLTVVRVLREVRAPFAAAHAAILKRDPATLFDEAAILAQAKPGMIAVDNTDPVFLVFVRLTASSVSRSDAGTAMAVCRGIEELMAFIKKHSAPGAGATYFELAGVMYTMAANLAQTKPIKRGRGAS